MRLMNEMKACIKVEKIKPKFSQNWHVGTWWNMIVTENNSC